VAAAQTRDEGRKAMERLVERYERARSSGGGERYAEEQLREDFLSPFLEALGWDVRNDEGLPQRLRHAVVEPLLTGDDPEFSALGFPDYRLQPEGEPRTYLEAKKPSVEIERLPGPARQVRTYGWNGGAPIAFLSNFEHFAVYDTRSAPDRGDHAATARIDLFACAEYVTRFHELWDCASYEAVGSDAWSERYGFEADVRGTADFDAAFLDQLRSWRLRLGANIRRRRPETAIEDVSLAAQRVLNRLLFLRVAEDRGFEPYRSLQQAGDAGTVAQRFDAAARTYNSTVFEDRGDPAPSADVLREIVSEMYWPNPYAFGVLPVEVLATIYEQFIGEVFVVEQDELRLRQRPEITHQGGVVPTPPWLIDELLDEVLEPELLAAETSDAVLRVTVLDMACGSGPFLIRAIPRIIGRFEQLTGRRATLEERSRIVVSTCFGVDIDEAAVEVAALSLVLAILHGVSPDEVPPARRRLPVLDANLVVGNALVGDAFGRTFPELDARPDVRARIQAMEWEREFPRILPEPGFRVIVGNPPYVRIQSLKQYSPEEAAFYQHAASGYTGALRGSFDKSLLFIERALGLRAPNGRVGLLVPNRMLGTKPAQAVRQRLADDGRVAKLVNFGRQQLFAGRTTYPMLLILGPETESEVVWDRVTDVRQWRSGDSRFEFLVDTARLQNPTWMFPPPDVQRVLDKLAAVPHVPLKHVARVFVGVQTSADALVILDATQLDQETLAFTDGDGTAWEIEPESTRPALKKGDLPSLSIGITPNRRAIWPYDEAGDLIETGTFRDTFPRCFDYLESHRAALEARDLNPEPTDENWHRYGRSQSIREMGPGKIVVAGLTAFASPRYALDTTGVVVPGGGDGGPYYCLRPIPEVERGGVFEGCSDEDVALFLMAVLSHPVVDGFVCVSGREYNGGYFAHRRAFLDPVPLPAGATAAIPGIAGRVRGLGVARQRLREQLTSAERRSEERHERSLRAELRDSVGSLYGLTPDDVEVVLGYESERADQQTT
jgi:hypothetical protein